MPSSRRTRRAAGATGTFRSSTTSFGSQWYQVFFGRCGGAPRPVADDQGDRDDDDGGRDDRARRDRLAGEEPAEQDGDDRVDVRIGRNARGRRRLQEEDVRLNPRSDPATTRYASDQ